jgi:hypothetical protein
LPANEGKLIHVTGAVSASGTVSDPDLNIPFPGQVAFQRKAEMYQWKEDEHEETHDKLGGGQEKITTYTYSKDWSEEPIDSSQFKHPEGHANPAMPLKDARYAAAGSKLGGFDLDSTTSSLITLSTGLRPSAPAGWKQAGDNLYKGNDAAPNVGDLRVSYQGLASGSTVSVLAQQSHGGFAPFLTSNSYKIYMAEEGNQPANVMIAEKKKEESLSPGSSAAADFLESSSALRCSSVRYRRSPPSFRS